MNKGTRMDLNTHNITKLATQLATFYIFQKGMISVRYLSSASVIDLNVAQWHLVSHATSSKPTNHKTLPLYLRNRAWVLTQ